MISIAVVLALILFGAICISAGAALLLPIALAGAIFFLIRTLLDKVMDVSWMNGGVGIALFIILLWIII